MVETNTTISEFRVVTKRVIEIELAHPDAKLPFSADEGSSGYDLFSVEEVTLQPGERKIVPTGLKWNPNDNKLEMQIRSRSGLAYKHGIAVLNEPGTIDASYRGLIGVLLMNHGQLPVTLAKGERIAQAVIAKVEKDFDFEVVSNVAQSVRGEGGFGSTGRM